MADEAAREDACREYQSSLEDLTFNSKPHINMLTILAEENLQFAKDIVAIIEAQIAKAPPAEKLPVLYLVDSIVKNVGGEYLEVFAKNLVTSFICVFEKVDENTRKSLFKLRSTWDEIFPLKKLYALDVRVNSVDPAWPIKPLPPNVNASIHVNPKFLKPTEEVTSARVSTPQPQVHPKVPEKNLTQEQIIRQQLLAKQKQLLELQQKKIELELEQTKAQLAASSNHPPVTVQGQFDPVPVVSQPPPTSHKSWPPPQGDKISTRDPRLNRSSASSLNSKEQGTYKKETQVTPSVNAPNKRQASTERPSKLMRIPKKDTSATEEKAKSKSASPSSKGILNKSKDFEPEHAKASDVNKKDPRLRKQMHEKMDTKEEDIKEKKRSDKKERDDVVKGNEQQRSTNSRGKLVNGSLSKHERFDTFQKQDIKVSKANLRKRSRSRSRSPPVHSPKRKDRRSPKRRTRSITPPSKFGKGRLINKHSHNEDTAQQLNVREDRSLIKKSLSEQRRLKRPLEDRPLEHRDAEPQRVPVAEHKNTKDAKKWRSGWEESKSIKQSEPDLSHGKPGPQRHKTWSSNQRPPTPRTPKQHRLSVDANLQIPEVLNSANKRDLLRKANQRLANGELSHDDFLNVAHQIKQLFQYQEERQRSDSWEGSSDDGTYSSKRKAPHGQMSDAELSYFEHKSKLKRTQLQRPVRQTSPLNENMPHHRSHHEEDFFSETADAHKKGSDVLKPFSGHDDPRRNDRPPSRTGPALRKSQSPVNCDGISGKSQAVPFEGSSPPLEMEQFDDGEISPRFESPNSVHSGTGPDNDGPLCLETPTRHDVIPGPGRSGLNLVDSPGQTPPHSSELPNSQGNIQRHDGMTIPPRFDGRKTSHPAFEGPQAHVVQKRSEGLSRPHPPGRYEGNSGPGGYDGPGVHGPSRYDGHGRYDTHGPNRFERPPLLKGPERYDNQPMPHGPVRYGEHHGIGRFDGPGSGRFDSPMGPQGPGRFDGPGQMHYENSVQSNRFAGPTRFENPHLQPGLPAGFEGPMRYPAGPVNFEGQRRLEGPGNQTGIVRFETPAQPTPMIFDAQPGLPRYDPPQVPRYRGPPNMQNALRTQGQTLFDQQSQGPVLNPGVVQPNFNMAPNTFGGQPQQFLITPNVSPATNINVPGSTPSGFQNSYGPVTPLAGTAGTTLQAMAMMPASGQNFQPNPVPFNQPGSQFVQPESHLGQMDVNDLMAKLISSGIIKPAQTDSSSADTTSAPQPQIVPDDDEPEEDEQDEDENLPDMTAFTLDDMKQRYECVITKLYTGIQCYSCGMRFTASQTDVYADHLDWHYRQNRSEKDISKKVTHRRWYYSLTDWIEFEEIADLEERAKSQFFEKVHEEVVQKTQEAAKEREFQSVKAAPDVVDESCEICQEQFEMYWEEEEEEWHLKNAMRVDGKTYHPSCYEDYKNTSSFVDCTPSPNTMLTENPLNAFLKRESEGEGSCSSIKEEPAEGNADTVTVKEEVQVKLEGEN